MRWLLCLVLFVGCAESSPHPTSSASDGPTASPSIEFIGIKWNAPIPYTPTFFRAWSYTNDLYPNTRVVEQRLMDGELHSRWTECRKNESGKWVRHGVVVAYYESPDRFLQIAGVVDDAYDAGPAARIPMWESQ